MLVGCTLVTSLDGLGGDAGVADGGADVDADRRTDATWCDGVDAAFCDDFDRSDELSDAWLPLASDASASLATIDRFEFCSGPHALRVETKTVVDAGRNTQGISNLVTIPVQGKRHIVAEVRLKFRSGETRDMASWISMFALSINSPFGDRVLVNRLDTARLFLPRVGDAGASFPGASDFVTGECVRVVLDVVFAPAASGGRAILFEEVDGGMITLVDTGAIDVSSDSPSTATLNVGINNLGISPTATNYLVDDVIVRALP